MTVKNFIKFLSNFKKEENFRFSVTLNGKIYRIDATEKSVEFWHDTDGKLNCNIHIS